MDLVESTVSATRWRALRVAAALLLLVAAVAKFVNFVPILAGDGLLASWPLLLGVIAFEVAAGLYLLIGHDQWCWLLMLGTFAAFSLASGFALLSGRHCNCMGWSMIGPHVMLPLDLVFWGLTLWIRPPQDLPTERGPWMRSAPQVLICLLIGVFVAGGAAYVGQTDWRDGEPIEFLLADSLVGKSWPLDSRIHPQLKALESGKWLALIVRRDCNHCRELMAEYFSDPAIHPQDSRTVLFVAGSNQWPFHFDQIAIDQSVGDLVEWSANEPFVASPAIFLMEDGIIVGAKDGKESDGLMASLSDSLTQ